MTTTPDPYAKVNHRQAELRAIATAKEHAIVKRIADLRGRILTLRAEADKASRNYDLIKANSLRAEVASTDEIIHTLTSVELPAVRAELQAIAGYSTIELSAMMAAALTNERNWKIDKERSVQNALVASRTAFDDHLVSIATKQTLMLAQALADAATAAHGDAGSVVTALLAAKQAA
jgi:hypothetical protein